MFLHGSEENDDFFTFPNGLEKEPLGVDCERNSYEYENRQKETK